MSKFSFRVLAVGASTLLTACGGGGGGGAKPQPTPPPPVAASAFPLTASASFQAITGNRVYRRPGGVVTTDRFDAAGRDANFTIKYDSANGTYTVQDGSATAGFAASDRAAPSGYMDVYTKQVGTVSDELKLYNNVRAGSSQSGAPIQLTYLSYGSWFRNDTSTGQKRTSYLLFGYPTGTSDMPRTGSATYQTSVSANMIDARFASVETAVGGTATFSADFGSASVNTNLTVDYVGTFNGTGAISGNQFSGSFSSSDPFFKSGSFAGGFFGPAANEMGYAFAIQTGSEDPYAYAGPAPFMTWVTGLVVGKKN